MEQDKPCFPKNFEAENPSKEIDIERIRINEAVHEPLTIGNTFILNEQKVVSLPEKLCYQEYPRLIGILFLIVKESDDLDDYITEFIELCKLSDYKSEYYKLGKHEQGVLYQLKHKKWSASIIRRLTSAQVINIIFALIKSKEISSPDLERYIENINLQP